MQDALDRYLPKRSFRLHSTDKPWITPKIKSWIAQRQRFLAKFGKNSSLFRLWRNKVSSAIATCKRSFYVAKVKNLKNTNTSRWWREVKNLSGISGNSGQWYRQLIDGQIIDSVDKLCLKINEIFAGLTSSFTPLDSSDISNIVVQNVPEDLLASSHEAYVALRSVRVRKAAGPDDIPNIVLKVFAFELAPVIADLYNSSLRMVIFPPCLRWPLSVRFLRWVFPNPSRAISGPSLSPVRLLS